MVTAPGPPPLMGSNPLQGPLEGVGSENQDFLGPENGLEEEICTDNPHLLPNNPARPSNTGTVHLCTNGGGLIGGVNVWQ